MWSWHPVYTYTLLLLQLPPGARTWTPPPPHTKHGRFFATTRNKSLSLATQEEEDDCCCEIILLSEGSTLWELLEKAGVDPRQAHAEPLHGKAAFCNKLYRITAYNEEKTTSMIAKIFSSLALARMDPDLELGEFDVFLGNLGLSPRVLARNGKGIVMEECRGKVLSEKDVHDGNSSESVVRQCAQALARLHSLHPTPPPQRTLSTTGARRREDPTTSGKKNMLWRACHVMLANIHQKWQCRGGWTKQRLQQVLERHRSFVESNVVTECPTVLLGHGDCKPSNIILAPDQGVQFIDLELAGMHYRGFDIAKYLRTGNNASENDRSQRIFLETYREFSTCGVDDNTLEMEVELLKPLTWLEAAIFFACMENTCPPQERDKWNGLAEDRLEKYSHCMQVSPLYDRFSSFGTPS